MKPSTFNFSKTYLFVVAVLCSATVMAVDDEQKLDEIQVVTKVNNATDPLSGTIKPNEISVNKQSLRKRASTLGNALNGELGVHSSQFGGGASAPIIRGQEGVRLKILQNNLDVIDMSQLSPDHAIAVDTLLAENVEIVRGASTLLYATASPSGVINVIDNRIPTEIPEKGYALDLGWRYNRNSKERVQNGALSLALGQHIALRMEGLKRNAGDYRVPQLQFNEQPVQQLPNSFNQSKVATIGASWIGERGYFGLAYSERKDKYGLVGHNHKFDSCYGHIVNPLNQHFVNRYYLHFYPHLMDDTDVLEGAHFDCGSGHENGATPSHSHPFGHHIAGNPFIDMRLKRYEARAELNKPLPGLSKIRINFSMSKYYHDEKEEADNPVNLFNNKGKNIRVEFFHEPIGELRGLIGFQYQTQTSSAYVPRLSQPPRCFNNNRTELDKLLHSINGEDGSCQPPKKHHASAPMLRNDTVKFGSLDALIRDINGEASNEKPAENSTRSVQPLLVSSRSADLSFIRPNLIDLSGLSNNSNTSSREDEDLADEDLEEEEMTDLDNDNATFDEDFTDNLETNTQPHGAVGVDDFLAHLNKTQPALTPKDNTPPKTENIATWKDRETSDNRYALIENTNKQLSFFVMEQLNWRDFMFEAALRTELQTIKIDYDHSLLANKGVGISTNIQEPDLSPYRERATSYALGTHWNFKPNYMLSLIFSHNERLPTPMELYYHGKHLATNSFEYGNKDLNKEVSDNIELGINYQDQRWHYTINAYYNHFKNRIFKRTLNKEGNLSMNRYGQARADYYGIEGKIDYQLTNNTEIGIFGDYVRGILRDLPPLRLKDSQKNTYELAANKNAPRVPPARLGFHLEHQFNDNLAGSLQLTHSFAQRKTARLEDSTDGYNLLNAGLSYQGNFKQMEYSIFIEGNNLLNQKIYSHTSFLPYVPQMGRNFVLGVNMSF